MTRIKVPIPKGGENNLESKFLRAQSGDPAAVKEYRAALDDDNEPKLEMVRHGEMESLRQRNAELERERDQFSQMAHRLRALEKEQHERADRLERECEGMRGALARLVQLIEAQTTSPRCRWIMTGPTFREAQEQLRVVKDAKRYPCVAGADGACTASTK